MGTEMATCRRQLRVAELVLVLCVIFDVQFWICGALPGKEATGGRWKGSRHAALEEARQLAAVRLTNSLSTSRRRQPALESELPAATNTIPQPQLSGQASVRPHYKRAAKRALKRRRRAKPQGLSYAQLALEVPDTSCPASAAEQQQQQQAAITLAGPCQGSAGFSPTPGRGPAAELVPASLPFTGADGATDQLQGPAEAMPAATASHGSGDSTAPEQLRPCIEPATDTAADGPGAPQASQPSRSSPSSHNSSSSSNVPNGEGIADSAAAAAGSPPANAPSKAQAAAAKGLLQRALGGTTQLASKLPNPQALLAGSGGQLQQLAQQLQQQAARLKTGAQLQQLGQRLQQQAAQLKPGETVKKAAAAAAALPQQGRQLAGGLAGMAREATAAVDSLKEGQQHIWQQAKGVAAATKGKASSALNKLRSFVRRSSGPQGAAAGAAAAGAGAAAAAGAGAAAAAGAGAAAAAGAGLPASHGDAVGGLPPQGRQPGPAPQAERDIVAAAVEAEGRPPHSGPGVGAAGSSFGPGSFQRAAEAGSGGLFSHLLLFMLGFLLRGWLLSVSRNPPHSSRDSRADTAPTAAQEQVELQQEAPVSKPAATATAVAAAASLASGATGWQRASVDLLASRDQGNAPSGFKAASPEALGYLEGEGASGRAEALRGKDLGGQSVDGKGPGEVQGAGLGPAEAPAGAEGWSGEDRASEPCCSSNLGLGEGPVEPGGSPKWTGGQQLLMQQQDGVHPHPQQQQEDQDQKGLLRDEHEESQQMLGEQQQQDLPEDEDAEVERRGKQPQQLGREQQQQRQQHKHEHRNLGPLGSRLVPGEAPVKQQQQQEQEGRQPLPHLPLQGAQGRQHRQLLLIQQAPGQQQQGALEQVQGRELQAPRPFIRVEVDGNPESLQLLAQAVQSISWPLHSLSLAAHRLSAAAEVGAASLGHLSHSVHHISSSVGSLLGLQRAAAEAAALGQQRQAVADASQLGLLLHLVMLGYMALCYGRLWEVHQVCDAHGLRAGSSWWPRATGMAGAVRWWDYCTCVGEQLGLYTLALAAIYYLVRSALSGQLHAYTSQGVSSSSSSGGVSSSLLDIVVWKGVIGSIVGAYVVHCLGGAWLPWLGLWLLWCGVQGALSCRQYRVWGLAAGLTGVSVLQPVFVAWLPFHPNGVKLQAMLLDRILT